uniref:Uncharacterized protein n=1 Tax=Kalanchoe fedtschenkoi TaxID=63787 RepID=A0A7N0TWN2_KALFE
MTRTTASSSTLVRGPPPLRRLVPLRGVGQELQLPALHERPSGKYAGWKAAAIGANNQAAQSMLKQDYKDEITRDEAVQLALKVLSKTMDSTSLTSDKLELAEVFFGPSGAVKYEVCSPEKLSKLLVKVGVTQPPAEAS